MVFLDLKKSLIMAYVGLGAVSQVAGFIVKEGCQDICVKNGNGKCDVSNFGEKIAMSQVTSKTGHITFIDSSSKTAYKKNGEEANLKLWFEEYGVDQTTVSVDNKGGKAAYVQLDIKGQSLVFKVSDLLAGKCSIFAADGSFNKKYVTAVRAYKGK